MHLQSLTLKGFRSYQETTVTFDPSLTTLVGENNVGKSTISLALTKLFARLSDTSVGVIGLEDYPYGVQGPLAFKATLALSPTELENLLIRPLLPLPPAYLEVHIAQMRDWLLQQGAEVVLEMGDSLGFFVEIRWGNLYFVESQVTLEKPSWQGIKGQNQAWGDFLYAVACTNQPPLPSEGVVTNAPILARAVFGPILQQRFRRVEEFRTGSLPGQRSPAIEAMTGGDTASVLLNLKSHVARAERERYRQITAAFAKLFPRYEIEAVEMVAGGGQADIQFIEKGHANPLSLSHVSAGVKQTLTLLVNLIGRQDLLLFVEHPEQHLHPHGMRFAQSLLVEASRRNQIVVVTHDPHFVDRYSLQALSLHF